MDQSRKVQTPGEFISNNRSLAVVRVVEVTHSATYNCEDVSYRQLEPGSSSVTGFFVTDFSLQELKALDAKQPFAFRSAEHTTGGEQIAQISEIFALFKSARRNGSSAGLYMELKHPQYHADLVCLDAKHTMLCLPSQ